MLVVIGEDADVVDAYPTTPRKLVAFDERLRFSILYKVGKKHPNAPQPAKFNMKNLRSTEVGNGFGPRAGPNLIPASFQV